MVSRINSYPNIDTQVSPDTGPLHVLLLGMCQVGPLVLNPSPGITVDHILYESFEHSAQPEVDVEKYDVIVIGLTLRHFMIEASVGFEPNQPWGNDILWPRLIAEGNITAYFERCAELVRLRVADAAALFDAKPVFIMLFFEPKHNYLGNLLPRYSLTNFKYFVEQLNRVIAEVVESQEGVYILDINELAQLVGTARLHDDYIMQTSHASFIIDHMVEESRIQISTPPTQMWKSEVAFRDFGELVWQRVWDDVRILRRPLVIKAIIVDLDDTMWRGIAAEDDKHFNEFAEGWPLGFAEALLIYKARGGILAICSKNDFATASDRFNYIFQGRMRLTDFASHRINFERKSQNIAEILSEINLLPGNVLYIDDNPREIDEVRTRFPEMSFLSEEHYDWRRKVLTSPDMQVFAINDDAALRTNSIQAQIAQRVAERSMSRDEWLAELQIVETLSLVNRVDDVNFSRMLELLNKTNQFNTTGRRWLSNDLRDLFADGGVGICAFAKDRIADHGMIGVALVNENVIQQVVLSCRVFGNGIELALGWYATKLALAGGNGAVGAITDTGRNKTCHDFFSRLGYHPSDDGLFATNSLPDKAPFIDVVIAEQLPH